MLNIETKKKKKKRFGQWGLKKIYFVVILAFQKIKHNLVLIWLVHTEFIKTHWWVISDSSSALINHFPCKHIYLFTGVLFDRWGVRKAIFSTIYPPFSTRDVRELFHNQFYWCGISMCLVVMRAKFITDVFKKSWRTRGLCFTKGVRSLYPALIIDVWCIMNPFEALNWILKKSGFLPL